MQMVSNSESGGLVSQLQGVALEMKELRPTLMATTMTSDLTVSLRTTVPFRDCLEFLKQALFRAGFHIIAEVPFHRAFEKHLGVRMANYAALIVWNPFQAYRAVLSDHEAGLFNPFSLVVADEDRFTAVLSTNHDYLGKHATSVAMRVLSRDLDKRMRQIFAELEALDRLETNLSAQEVRKEAS
jgi:uncharacterized protein (DUF302 family)